MSETNIFEVERDSDPRRTELFVTRIEGRFHLADEGKILSLSLSEARKLVEALMEETTRVDLADFWSSQALATEEDG